MTAIVRQMIVALMMLTVGGNVAYAVDEVGVSALQRHVDVSGRGIATLRFDVENKTGVTQEFVENITLEEGWSLLSTPAPFLLAANAREVRLVHLSVPRGIAAGTYSIRYTLSARNNASVNSTESVFVRVLGRPGMALTQLQSSDQLLAGETYETVFQVENSGNQTITYAIDVDDFDGYVDKISPKKLTLEAGQFGQFTVSGRIPKRLRESGTHYFVVIVKGGGETTEKRVNIPLVAAKPKSLGKYHRLHGLMTLSQSESNDEQQTQVTAFLQGAIDREGEHHVSIKLRNGSSDSQANNADQSDYRAAYWNDDWKVDLGHNSFYAGRLAGNSVSGLGAEVLYSPRNEKGSKPLQVRAFTGESRPADTAQEKVTGLVGQYRFNDKQLTVGASLLNHETEGEDTTTISTVNSAWTNDLFTLRGEFASDQNAAARYLDIASQWGKVGLVASHLQGDTGFKGSNEDQEINHLGANWSIDKKNRLNLSARRSRDNLEDDNQSAILQSDDKQIEYTHVFGDDLNIELAAAYLLRDEKDLRDTPTVDKTIDSKRLTYRHSLDEFNIRAEWEQGKRDDQIQGDANGSRQQLAIDWHPSRNWSVGATYSLNHDLDTTGQSQSLGVKGRYRFDRKKNISAYWQETSNEQTGLSTESYNATYNHEFQSGHRMSLSANQQISSGSTDAGDDLEWRINYSVPFSMPIKRRDDIGSLRGDAYFADTGQPARNLIVDLDGQYAVTDEQGKFSYPDIMAKEYDLQINSSRLDNGNYLLSDAGGVMNLNLQANESKHVKLVLKQGALIHGTLKRFENNLKSVAVMQAGNVQSALQAVDGVAGVLIELTPLGGGSEARVHRRITDSSGSFRFLGISPGQWQINVVDVDKMPRNYRLERNNIVVNLSQGKEEEVTIRVLPKEQTIKKLGPSGGFTVSG